MFLRIRGARHCINGTNRRSVSPVSWYGHVINPGSADPFDYGALLCLVSESDLCGEDEEHSEDGEDGMSLRSVSMSMSVDDTFAFDAKQQRLHGVVEVSSSSEGSGCE
jgi:hypothetical protein